MAKALAFKRPTHEVVVIDTINNSFAAVGSAPVGPDTSTTFAGRTRNIVGAYRGDVYLLYRNAANELRLTAYNGTTWADVAGFGPIVSPGGNIQPVGVHVVQDRLVLIWSTTGGGGTDGLYAAASTDGVTWAGSSSLIGTTQPNSFQGGSSVVWRNAVFVAYEDGMAYLDALTGANGTWSAFDVGGDLGLVGTTLQVGSFAFWNNELFFVKPDVVPTIYSLDTAFTTASPPPLPMWSNRLPTGIPGLGTVTVGESTGHFLLFVNKLDELCLLYSAQLGTKLIKAAASDFPIFTDVTDPLLPEALRTETNLGFALFVDDRRRVNELQSFLIRFPSAGDTQLASWDGSTALVVRTTFSGEVFMPSDERFGAVRTFTGGQPTSHIRAVSAPFPGRHQIDYTVRESLSRPVDVFGEYSTDGDVWLPMTQGDGDSGATGLVTSPAGTDYSFFWDAFQDLDGDLDNAHMRIVARIAGV